MRRSKTAAAAALAVAATISLGAADGAAANGDETVWVCNPRLAADVCRESLATTVRSPGEDDRVVIPGPRRKSPLDCFYVYPTVSDQPTLNADRSIDEQIEGMTRLQAGYLQRHCRVYAPVYRQLTVPALLTRSEEEVKQGLRNAYPDVEAAWLDYWRNYNRGRSGRRPFVLVGHSQGSAMLMNLLHRLHDERPRMRRPMLSAFLLGVLPTVPAGERVGGLYEHLPTCGRRRQLGCILGWATYDETPPEDTRYGVPPYRIADAFGWEIEPGDEVICTNPAHLKRNRGRLKTLVRSDGFDGLVGLAILGLYELQPPEAATPWIRADTDAHRARCVREGGRHYLMATPAVAGARDYRASPDDTWGLHLIDLNIAYGNVLRIIRAEKRAYARARR